MLLSVLSCAFVPLCYRAFVGISWVQIFYSYVFRLPKYFSRRYFVGPIFFLEIISWVQKFFSWYFVGPTFFFKGNFMIQEFLLLGSMRRCDRKQLIHKYISNRVFKSIPAIIGSVYVRKVLHPLN